MFLLSTWGKWHESDLVGSKLPEAGLPQGCEQASEAAGRTLSFPRSKGALGSAGVLVGWAVRRPRGRIGGLTSPTAHRAPELR